MGGLERTPPLIRKPAAAASPRSPRPPNSFTSLSGSPPPAAFPPSPQPSTSNAQVPPPLRQSSRKRGPHPRYTQFDLSGDFIPSSRRRNRPLDFLSQPSTPVRHTSPPPPRTPAVAQPSARAAPTPAAPVPLFSPPPPVPNVCQADAARPPPTPNLPGVLQSRAPAQGHAAPPLQPFAPPLDLDPEEEENFWRDIPPIQHDQVLAEEVAVNSQPPPQQQAGLHPPVPLPSFEEASQKYIPTLKWPPRSVRADFTRTLADLWQQVADKPDDVQGWLLVYIFTRAVLPARIGGDEQGESKAKLIKERLRRWRQGEFAALWSEAVQLSSQKPKARKKKAGAAPEKSQHDLNVERATKLCQEGQYTKALQALVSLGLADESAATLREMQSKHPQSAPPVIPTTDVAPLSFAPSQVLEACTTFHKGTAAGPCGLRPEHLMIMLKASPANRVAKAETQLTRLVNKMAKGDVPAAVSPYLCGARLIAAKKTSGDLRPIAVGNLLRRLTSKLFAKAVNDRMENLLAPHQLGVGVRGGCEAAVHAVRKASTDNPGKWVLQLDLENAFNCVDRGHVLNEVATLLPDCLAWTVSCYGSPSFLQFGKNTITSSSGVQQGDPFAAVCFALVLQPVIKAVEAEVPTLASNVWLHDDGTAVGNKEELQQVVDIVKRDGPPRGLHLQPDKSTVWSPSPIAPGVKYPLGRGIKQIEESGIKLLGAPIGSDEFISKFIQKRIEKIRTITSELPSLHQPHLEFVLLRSCLSLPKISYLLRTTNTSQFQPLLREFDSITREALNRILGGPASDEAWAQAKIPISMGGLGLRAAEDHSSVAFSISLLSAQPIVQTLLHEEEAEPISLPAQLLQDVTAKVGAEEEVTSEFFQNYTQKMLSSKVDLHNQHLLIEQLKAQGSTREVARFSSVSIKDAHAADYLSVVPSPGLGLLLRPSEFVAAIRYRLGHPVFGSDGPCPACGRPSDRFGDHALNCAWQGERIARHNALRDTLYSAAVKAALGPTKEGQYLIPGEGGKPADVFIPRHSGGKDAALDVTVVNPLQAALVHQAAQTPGHALSVAHKRKMDKSWQPCNQQGIVFLPLAVESLGAWHKSAIQEVKKLGSLLARHTGEEEAITTKHLFQQLSLALVKGNAALLNNRNPGAAFGRDEGIGW